METQAQFKKNIHQRLHAAMNKVDYVQKSESNGMKYKFVSHDAVTSVVRPVLVECGIVYYPQNMRTTTDGNRVTAEFDVRFVNVDDPGDFIDVPTFGFGIDAQDKGPGKAMSYGVKYALLKALGLETGDDPERDNIDHQPAQKQPELRPVMGAELADLKGRLHKAVNSTELDEAKGLVRAAWLRMSPEQQSVAKAAVDEAVKRLVQAP